ncbi:ElyC/SanA/YdcF family protein [Propionicimonas sp.]|uniref:ElyC/SanA/YdcF family protein n=1 Tax=Propionicimonas sp. TaxID=1955623 RepID=UPI0039E4ED96
MEPIRTVRVLAATVVAAVFIALTGGIVVESPSHAAAVASQTSLKAQAIYFQQDRDTGRRDLAVASMAAHSAWQNQLWSGFVKSWSTINNSMVMNSTVPAGLPKKGHVFVVLGSALKKSGKVSVKFERRLKVAVKALKKYPRSKVLVTGGAPKNGHTEGEVGYKWLVAKGIAGSRIIVEKKAASTIGNAKNSMAILAKSSAYTSYSLISDSSHLRRASILFDAAAVLVQEKSGKPWGIERLANVAYMDMKSAGKVPLADWSVTYTAGNVAALFGITSTYKKLLADAPAKAVLTSVAVTSPTKVSYAVGQELSTKGLAVTALYNKGVYSRDVTSTAKLSGFDSSAAGTGTVTATYSDGGVSKSASFEYTIARSASTLALKRSTSTVRAGVTRLTVKATVGAESSDVVPTGYVKFYLDGTRLKTITLTGKDAGVARFRFPKIGGKGTHRIVVKYLGSDQLGAVRKELAVAVS